MQEPRFIARALFYDMLRGCMRQIRSDPPKQAPVAFLPIRRARKLDARVRPPSTDRQQVLLQLAHYFVNVYGLA